MFGQSKEVKIIYTFNHILKPFCYLNDFNNILDRKNGLQTARYFL